MLRDKKVFQAGLVKMTIRIFELMTCFYYFYIMKRILL